MIGIELAMEPPPGIHIRDATLDDVKELTRLWYASFYHSHKFFVTVTPDDAATRAWFDELFTLGIRAGPSVIKTVVAEDVHEKRVVGFGRTHLPQPDGNQDIPFPPSVPASWDPEITNAFWGGMARCRADVLDCRMHWMGEFAAVIPELQSKGITSAMLSWMCSQADETNLEAYIDATRAGLPLYKAYGFQEVKTLYMPERPETYGKYEMVAMVRLPKSRQIQSHL
ncbi:acyl-CoA N-acyltransferase [Stachybotrys elegans]|uniref:Acyl-CoA N-acyltransferase n=1 Tax=Stachybotrys elegans TaxID=80388 RepID=A0A8K0WLF8_9HYPO|nr:acyl-CoA N-acyltransferase [Stachybotrys elegans]